MSNYGWRKDGLDRRDFIHAPKQSISRLPVTLDLSSRFPPCYDQGALGSCTAQAIAGLLQYRRRVEKLPDYIPSRLFIYYYEREMEGTITSDAGAEIRDGMKVVAKMGAPDEKLWPYDTSVFDKSPGDAVGGEAVKHLALRYARVPQTVKSLRRALYERHPVVFGVSVFDSFESEAAATTGVIPMPGSGERLLGGHAILLVGYDDGRNRYRFRNSWSPAWGDKGYGYMPYEYVHSHELASDFWTASFVT